MVKKGKRCVVSLEYILEDGVENLMSLNRSLQESLHSRCQQNFLHPSLIGIVLLFIFNVLLKQIGCLRNLKSKIAKNPDKSFDRLSLVDITSIRDKGGQHFLEKFGIFSQNLVEAEHDLVC